LRATRTDRPKQFDRHVYDAVYVDEGQDLTVLEYVLLKELCRVESGQEPNLYVFYDDAQNLYGRKRPNWTTLGLNLRGARSTVITQCHPNTRQIVDVGINVLYASAGPLEPNAPSRDFFDLAGLEDKNLVSSRDGMLRVAFASRNGHWPMFTLASDSRVETDLLIARLAILICKERVRPEDILVLGYSGRRVLEFAAAAERAKIPAVAGISRPTLKPKRTNHFAAGEN